MKNYDKDYEYLERDIANLDIERIAREISLRFVLG